MASEAAVRVHLDTDLGGDPDDACALAMLLGWPGVEIVGITTTIDPGGQRAGCVHHCLGLAGREEIPVVAGAESSLTRRCLAHPTVADRRYWQAEIRPAPSPPGAAVESLARSVEAGATVIAIGPLTNLAQLEVARHGLLRRARVVAMGGWLEPPADGLPAWGPEQDFNIQWDTRAAEIVAAAADLTLVPLAVTLKAQLRARDLPRLSAAGRLGKLLAQQSAARGADAAMGELGRAHRGLPDDLVNFHYDPVTCAVAVGWQGATIEQVPLRPTLENGVLRFVCADDGRPTAVVRDLDGAAFAPTWLEAVEAATSKRT